LSISIPYRAIKLFPFKFFFNLPSYKEGIRGLISGLKPPFKVYGLQISLQDRGGSLKLPILTIIIPRGGNTS